MRLGATVHDPLNQTVYTQHIAISASGVRLFPVCIRYSWPSELDLKARLAGLSLAERWGGWRGEPYTAASGGHVSVYRRE